MCGQGLPAAGRPHDSPRPQRQQRAPGRRPRRLPAWQQQDAARCGGARAGAPADHAPLGCHARAGRGGVAALGCIRAAAAGPSAGRRQHVPPALPRPPSHTPRTPPTIPPMTACRCCWLPRCLPPAGPGVCVSAQGGRPAGGGLGALVPAGEARGGGWDRGVVRPRLLPRAQPQPGAHGRCVRA